MALSRSAPTPRISRFRAIGSRPSGCSCRPFNTRHANCLAHQLKLLLGIQVNEVVSKNAQRNSGAYGGSQRSAVLGLRPAEQRFGQRGLCRPYPTASGSLRQLAARLGLADRQSRRVPSRFSPNPRRQPGRAHTTAHTYQSDVETVQIMYIMLQYFDCDVIGPFFCRIG